MNVRNGKALLLALCLAAALLLASCGPKSASSQGSQGETSSAAGSSSSEEEDAGPQETLQGTVNLVDEELELLVLVSDDNYYKFDSAKADLSGLAPGDAVTVTYTGTLEANSDLVSAVLVSVTKDAA